jgi:hypothetical protein
VTGRSESASFEAVLQPGQWVEVTLTKGVRSARIVEVQGARCCCVFEDGQKAWVATSAIRSEASGASIAPPTSHAPVAAVPAPATPSGGSAADGRWALWALLAFVTLLAAGGVSFALWRRAAAQKQAAELAKRAEAVPVELRPIVNGISLPLLTTGAELFKPGEALNIEIDRTSVYVEAERVEALEPYRAAGRLQRMDSLFNHAKNAREAWKAAHPNEEFSGVAQLWVHEDTQARLLKDVFQTSAFAGYPNLTFVMRRRDDPSKLGRLNADAVVPGPPRDGPSEDPDRPARMLGVVLHADDQVELAWVGEGLEPPIERRLPLSALRSTMLELWKAHAPGTPPDAKHWEQAHLSVPNDVPFRKIAQVLDGLNAPRIRLDPTRAEEYPAFNVTFKVQVAEAARFFAEAGRMTTEFNGKTRADGPRARIGTAVISGRLPPAVIQKVVRGSWESFRQCYDAVLAKKPDYTSRVSLRFVIQLDGSVGNADVSPDSAPRDESLEGCLLAAVKQLRFPAPEGGIVTVVYPIVLSPG